MAFTEARGLAPSRGKTTRVVLERSTSSECRGLGAAAVFDNQPWGSAPPARDPLAATEAYRKHGADLWAAGDVVGALGRWERALETAIEERGRVPDADASAAEAAARKNLACALLKLQRFEKAHEHAKAALMIDPHCSKSRFRLAEACGGLGDWIGAEDALDLLRTQGHDTAALLGRTKLRARKLAAQEAEKGLAARMLGESSQRSSVPRLRENVPPEAAVVEEDVPRAVFELLPTETDGGHAQPPLGSSLLLRDWPTEGLSNMD
eukprot:TRINITY_DN56379_c0_g1_i1.p1 TRINITY_DN56379_c0_g1~~TRINITY_DN56379_c0_g1_i1.p1  ORF type:complete len:265 (+),score=47.77 TRINITY_DN56379_c0_g1_i1:224-1018(+)